MPNLKFHLTPPLTEDKEVFDSDNGLFNLRDQGGDSSQRTVGRPSNNANEINEGE